MARRARSRSLSISGERLWSRSIKANLLFDVLGIVVPGALMFLNGFFKNVEFVLVGAFLGVPFEPRPKARH
jgi:hypothetical protein